MAKNIERRFTEVKLSDIIMREIHEHEVFLSFFNDEDAAFFYEWWEDDGAVLFQKFVDSREISEQ